MDNLSFSRKKIENLAARGEAAAGLDFGRSSTLLTFANHRRKQKGNDKRLPIIWFIVSRFPILLSFYLSLLAN
jgi:hypothetical protein